MKISPWIAIGLTIFLFAEVAPAQTTAPTPTKPAAKGPPKECSQPLSAESRADIICDETDKNLSKARPGATAPTQAGAPEVEQPGTCDKCTDLKNRYTGRLGDTTNAAATSSGSAPGRPAGPGTRNLEGQGD